MALLEEATMAEMVDFIGQSLSEAEKGDEPVEPQAETEEVVESSEASEDVNEEEASPSDTDEDVKEEPGEEQEVVEVQVEDSEPEEPQRQKDSKWVPRDRINEVNEKWRQREQELMMQLGALNERVNSLSSAQKQQRAQAQSEPDWLDTLLEDDAPQQVREDPRIAQLQAQQQRILEWQEQQVRAQVYNEFNQELSAAMEKYPSIPEQVFRDAVARDGSVNMLELGESLSSEREKLVSQWKSDWEKSQPKAEATVEDEVRRPSRRSTVSSTPAKTEAKSYSTVREAGDAMANELAEFFESLNQ